jgi:hypothetical protein
MSDGKAASKHGGSTLESLEERQWRLKVEQAKAELTREEDEWKGLLERSKRALENEEREWARVMARAHARSGSFAAQPEPATPPSRAKAASSDGGTPPPLPRAKSGKR